MQILRYCIFHSNAGLYTTFIFQKPDPEIAPPVATPLLQDASYNHDEVTDSIIDYFTLIYHFYFDQYLSYSQECAGCPFFLFSSFYHASTI